MPDWISVQRRAHGFAGQRPARNRTPTAAATALPIVGATLVLPDSRTAFAPQGWGAATRPAPIRHPAVPSSRRYTARREARPDDREHHFAPSRRGTPRRRGGGTYTCTRDHWGIVRWDSLENTLVCGGQVWGAGPCGQRWPYR